MKKSISRQSLRTWLTLVLFGMLGWQLIYPWIRQPLERKQKALAEEQATVGDQQRKIELLMGYLRDLRAFGQRSLQPDPSLASIRFQEWLRKNCEDSNILNTDIDLHTPIIEDQLGAKVSASLHLVAGLEQIGGLVDRLAASEMLQRATRLKIKTLQESGPTSCELDLVAMAIADNPHFDAGVFAKQRKLVGLSDWMQSSKHFCRHRDPTPEPSMDLTTITAKQDAPRETKVSRTYVDRLKWVRLVAIVSKDGTPRAWFHDSQNKSDITVEVSQPIELEGFQASITRIDDSQVQLWHEGKEIRVPLGSTLRQGIDSASAFSIP